MRNIDKPPYFPLLESSFAILTPDTFPISDLYHNEAYSWSRLIFLQIINFVDEKLTSTSLRRALNGEKSSMVLAKSTPCSKTVVFTYKDTETMTKPY